jgi:hypothetical protein
MSRKRNVAELQKSGYSSDAFQKSLPTKRRKVISPESSDSDNT